jgi:stress response protein SCP2
MLNFAKVQPGSSLNFAKDTGVLHFGMNWSTMKNGSSVDLDAGILIAKKSSVKGFLGFGSKSSAEVVEFCNFGSPLVPGDPRGSKRRATARITHSGDDRVGDTSLDYSDNEVVSFDPASLKEDEVALIGLWSFQGHNLKDVPRAGVRVYKGAPNAPTEALAEVDLTDMSGRSLTLGSVTFENGAAVFRSIGKCGNSTYPSDWSKEALAYV